MPQTLTKTELAVVNELAKGFTQREIAERRHRSYETIRNHVKNSLVKMHARNSVNLVAIAKDLALIMILLSVMASCFRVDDFSQRKSRLTRSFSIRVGRVREDVI